MKPIGEEKGCEYCREEDGCYVEFDRGLIVEVYGCTLRFAVEVEFLSSRFTEWAHVPIRYCPMCGRKLTDEDGRKGDEL